MKKSRALKIVVCSVSFLILLSLGRFFYEWWLVETGGERALRRAQELFNVTCAEFTEEELSLVEQNKLRIQKHGYASDLAQTLAETFVRCARLSEAPENLVIVKIDRETYAHHSFVYYHIVDSDKTQYWFAVSNSEVAFATINSRDGEIIYSPDGIR